MRADVTAQARDKFGEWMAMDNPDSEEKNPYVSKFQF
jgi:hypothetical protein